MIDQARYRTTHGGVAQAPLDVVLLVDDISGLVNEDSAETFLFASEAVEAIETALARLGHRHRRLSFEMGVPEMVARLSSEPPDVVFHLGQPVPTDPLGEAQVTALLDMLRIAHTSEAPATLMLAGDKALAKAVCVHHGLPTPAYAVASHGDLPRSLPPGPWIAKPTLEDGSRGITAKAWTSEQHELAETVHALYVRFRQPVLIETFVSGREFQIGIVGPDVLPLVEVDFSALAIDRPAVASYESKWKYDSTDFSGTHYVCPARAEALVENSLKTLARQTASAFNIRRYARLDVRTDSAGAVWLLDVNPNPDLSPIATMHRMAHVAGWGFEGLVQRLLDLARARSAEVCCNG
jgi:D-alanine-D-alanine ligase